MTSGEFDKLTNGIFRIVMAGILNSKERILDFIVTQEGKRQAGTGELRIRYASFTDLHTFYETSGSFTNPKLASDASERIFFEAGNRYQDVIVPELEAGYSMRPFKTSDFDWVGGTISSGTIRTSLNQSLNILSGTALKPALTGVLNGITKNFSDQRIIGTIDEFSLHQQIEITPTSCNFSIDDETDYLRAGEDGKVDLDDLPGVFSDRRFADFANFMYLPPISTPRPGEMVGELLGEYSRLNEQELLSLDDLMRSLKDKPKQQFLFSKTSRSNNIVVQFFEQDVSGVEKLSVVDFGAFDDDEPLSQGKRVLFVGKMQRDSFGTETFLGLFTIVID